MKSLMLFLQQVLEDFGNRCRISTNADFKTISVRVESEGLSFLTISLSNFGSDFQKSLDQGFVDHDLFSGFRFKGSLPQLFGGFFDLVFDRASGRLLDDPDINAIYAIRQTCLFFAKIKIDCTPGRNFKALRGYIECEQEVRLADDRRTEDMYLQYHRISRLLFRDIFTSIDMNVYYLDEISPKHGPGATANRLRGNSKWADKTWTSRLEKIFPHEEFLVPNYNFYHEVDDVTILEPGEEQPVKVVLVPKTQKTPRIIAEEPSYVMYMQKALQEMLYEKVESNTTLKTFIGFLDQKPNRVLAREGSISGRLATLDLSEASDRVSNQLVRRMLRDHPHFSSAVDATRSRKADVDGFGVQRLAKFASMGSALCFPFEAMVFLTLIFVGIERKLNRQITRRDIKSFLGKVRVFGDDIIIPVDFVHHVVGSLSDFGLKVNTSKSYWNGKFRESCGGDYYDGYDITAVRLRQLFPTQRGHAEEIRSLVSLRNQLYKAGLWGTVRYLDSLVEGLKLPFPAVAESSPIHGKFSYLGYETQAMDPNLHSPLVKGMVSSARLPISRLDGYAALNKIFLTRGELPLADRNHLERAGRPDSVDIKVRMARPF